MNTGKLPAASARTLPTPYAANMACWQHCSVWRYEADLDVMVIFCAHCGAVRETITDFDEAADRHLGEQQADESGRAHRADCRQSKGRSWV